MRGFPVNFSKGKGIDGTEMGSKPEGSSNGPV